MKTMLRIALWAPLLALATLTGCDDTNPCQEYVDYICGCGTDEECSEASNAYADADADLQDECAIALDDELEQDDEAGEDCAGSDSGR